MSQPLVSVLMTAYNREKYIAEALDSVLQSTFNDYEIIVVDDVSKDRTVEIVESYAAKDSRVKVFRNEKNLGDYNNRNKAASLATGKYIKYVDSDDKIYPETLDIMVSAMERHPIAALGLSLRPIDQDITVAEELKPGEAYRQHFFGDGFLENGPLAAIIRRDAFENAGRFSGKRMVGDVEMWLRLAARYPVLRLPKKLVFWREHEGQEFKQGFYYYLVNGLEVVINAMNDPACPLTKEEKDQIIGKKIKAGNKTLFRHLLKTAKLGEFLRIRRDFKSISNTYKHGTNS